MLVSWLISCGLSSAAVAEIIRFGNEGSGPGKRENLRITPEQNPRGSQNQASRHARN
jgi:hypothetical protein